MKELLPRSSVSYQFQAVLTAFYCAATRRVTAICLCHQTLRVQMQSLHAVYMRNTTRATQTVTRCAVFSCSVFKVHALLLYGGGGVGLARSFVGLLCLSCLVWLQCKRSHTESQALFCIFSRFGILHNVGGSTLCKVLHWTQKTGERL